MKTFCQYYNEDICRSCTLLELAYLEQINGKEQLLKTALGLSHLLPTVTSDQKHFRNKAKFSVTGTSENPIIGLLSKENLDVAHEILNCPVHHEKINEALPFIKELIKNAKLEPYRISEKKGELKGLILFHSNQTDQTYLRIVLRSKEALDRIKKWIPELLKSVPHLKSVSANIQPIPHAVLEGKEEIFFTEQTHLVHQLGKISVQVDPRAFIQTNEKISHELYRTAADWVKDLRVQSFMELYSGLGLFSFFAASSVKRALGLEINESAVMEANRTGKALGLSHLEFKCMDAERASLEMQNFSPEVVLVNPPRKGLGEGVKTLQALKVPYVIYSSCSHETLLSDLEKLKSDYQVEKVQIFDMFPHTRHFETLVLLKKVIDLADRP
jgi:23S rRNA (uracil747-C5)-methyltransferase